MSYIFLLTNPAMPDYIKFGVAENTEEIQRKSNTKALPCNYEIYCVYQTKTILTEKELGSLLLSLTSDNNDQVGNMFMRMTAEQGYNLLNVIAKISGTEKYLRKTKEENQEKNEEKVERKDPVNFYKCGLKDGDELVFVDNPDVIVTVCGAKKVMYNGKETSLSKVAAEIRGVKSVRGPDVFIYNGETLTKLAERTQWNQKEEAVM